MWPSYLFGNVNYITTANAFNVNVMDKKLSPAGSSIKNEASKHLHKTFIPKTVTLLNYQLHLFLVIYG